MSNDEVATNFSSLINRVYDQVSAPNRRFEQGAPSSKGGDETLNVETDDDHEDDDAAAAKSKNVETAELEKSAKKSGEDVPPKMPTEEGPSATEDVFIRRKRKEPVTEEEGGEGENKKKE